MKRVSTIITASLFSIALLGCSAGSTDSGNVPAPDTGTPSGNRFDSGVDNSSDSGGITNSNLPNWSLEDIQPQSPRFDQTYGLETFNGEVLVAMLLQGF